MVDLSIANRSLTRGYLTFTLPRLWLSDLPIQVPQVPDHVTDLWSAIGHSISRSIFVVLLQPRYGNLHQFTKWFTFLNTEKRSHRRIGVKSTVKHLKTSEKTTKASNFRRICSWYSKSQLSWADLWRQHSASGSQAGSQAEGVFLLPIVVANSH